MKETYGDKMTVSYIDLSDENSSKEVDDKYGTLSATPFVVLINDKGEEVHTFVGLKDKAEITQLLKDYGLIN